MIKNKSQIESILYNYFVKEFLIRNGKTFFSLIISFFLVIFVLPFFMTPDRFLKTLNNQLSIVNSKNVFDFFTSSIIISTKQKNINNSNNSNNFAYFQPSPAPSNRPSATPEPEVANGLVEQPKPTTFLQDFTKSVLTSTLTPKPTKKPKPTKAPDIFPIDPSLARPGKNPDEVFKIASEKTCVPKEVLKGIAYIESGGFFDVVSPKYFLLYNSYNWWNSEFLTEEKRICGGYGYDQNTGIVPEDSKFAGYKCKEGYNSGLNVMGVMSVSSYEQSKYAQKVANLLGVRSADRRVILDALMIVGLITKDNVKPTSCTNWTAKQVAKAACGYYGSCGFKDGTYYCNTFCRNYKKFGGKTNCQEAVNQMQDNCWQ